MSGPRMILRGGTVVDGAGARAADVLISGEQVAAVVAPGTPVTDAVEHDVNGRFLLPGLIDGHVHFREPGLEHKEDWEHGSRAAAAGGVTTVIDMPNTRPSLTTPELARAKHRRIDGRTLVDYRFHAGVDPTDVGAIKAFGPREANTVKVFLSGHHTAPEVVRDPADLDRLCRVAADVGLTVLCHAEQDDVFALLDRWRGEPSSALEYEKHRPRTAAIVAVARLVELARRHGTRIHILHVSSREEADLISAAAAAGIPVSFEITGHHLTFTDDDVAGLGSLIRLRPAIREAADRDRLWEAAIDGTATNAGSDHAPHTRAEKSRPAPDAPPGLPGVQELFPALYTGLTHRLPQAGPAQLLPVVARLMGEGPARLFGLDHRKGRIAAGRDADLVVFDPAGSRRLTPDRIYARCGWSAYRDVTFAGAVEMTMRRGSVIYRSTPDGAEFGDPGGQWLEPSPGVT
jgi:dihydroorotase